MVEAIAYATDFTPESIPAFTHALKLALLHRCRLDLIHVHPPQHEEKWDAFPHVRETLARWGLIAPGAEPKAMAELGLSVRKVEVADRNAVDGLTTFLLTHRPDLLVLATRGQGALSHWLSGSVAEAIAGHTHIPTLFLSPVSRPFVDAQTGALTMRKVLLPLAETPAPGRALAALARLLKPLGGAYDAIHVGTDPDAPAPTFLDAEGAALATRTVIGTVEDAIAAEAAADDVDLIAMPTAGRQGALEILAGSTTEHVMRRASRPLLALPA